MSLRLFTAISLGISSGQCRRSSVQRIEKALNCDERRDRWDDRRAARDVGSASNRRQRFKPRTIAAAEVHLGAILQVDAPVAAHPRCHFGDARNIHDV